MEKTGVFVGIGFDYKFGGRDKISSALKNRGCFVKEIDDSWPRNNYFHLNGKYFSEENYDGVFGNGGMLQKGEDFVLVSDAAFYYDDFSSELDINRLESDSNYYDDSKNLISEKGARKYGRCVHVAPTGNFFGTPNNGDIDLYTLVLPKSKILLHDSYFGRDANRYKDYNKIAEKENLKYIEFDGSKDGVWYPLNSLVLENSNRDLVFVDGNAKSLVKLLNKNDVDFVPVDMPKHYQVAGKINCQTNVFNKKDLELVEEGFL